jgi:predicted Zn-dependent peptidase
MYDLTLDFYDQAIHKIKQMTTERVQELAQQYLNWDEFLIVTAG